MKDKQAVPSISTEIFDGSEDMIGKYSIETANGEYFEDYSTSEQVSIQYTRYFLPRVDGLEEVFIGNVIKTGVSGEHWVTEKL